MFGIFRKNTTPDFDTAIEKALVEMTEQPLDTDEYRSAFATFKELVDLKEKSRRKVSPDTMAIIAANLAGILVIVSYEHAHVVASKALGHVIKAKI